LPIKVREMIRVIERDGRVLVATRGSHRRAKHPTKPGRVTIPGKLSHDLPAGTERSVRKQARLEEGT
jgi:predicted RNA binding protein YcfA (HicA-like mRNA interferase family)